ncbi:pyridoxal phosphate-dependent decarboxylase family protein [Aquimarina litoralis]|uniref:pyridoxal phosphate-dependent decarboxylase family protein n=1 Tax=Aquimarina litoralis TaxID=584605 RepID=UPI001C55DDAD|nr:aminotransferase class V-fold PLP-dependent enzyme [Aquimarina litoralis]
MSIQQQMRTELSKKKIFDQARSFAYEYIDGIEHMDVFPSKENIERLKTFDEPLSDKSSSAEEIIDQLHEFGSKATIAQLGGRYFGFVNGGAVPVALGVKWLSDVWDQCGGLYLTSPINSKLEQVCEQWLKTVFNLPMETVAGFVSGTSMANLSGLVAARFRLFKNLGWDINVKGINGAPEIKIFAHEQVHASIKKTLAMLGFGIENIHWIPSDTHGKLRLDRLPELDHRSLLILQAGNVNTGSFDDFDAICSQANKAGAWVHIDGAFGLWAAASKSLSYLTKGIEKASSWAVDGHKTLNTPYDSGIILCKDAEALISALQASGEYITYSEQRDPLLYTPELSKRSRAIELWATMKYLGKEGMNTMITEFHTRAKQLAEGLSESGFIILNEVVFNQVLIACENDQQTNFVLNTIQSSSQCWCGGSNWQGKSAIRISICSWMTTKEDINKTISIFTEAKNSLY